MTIKRIASRVDGAESTEARMFDFIITWQVDDVSEYLRHVQTAPKKGYCFYFNDYYPATENGPRRSVGPAWVESCSFSRPNKPMEKGAFQYEQKLKLRFVREKGQPVNIAPWLFPIRDWSVEGGKETTQIREFYLDNELNTPVPFQNSSGERLEGTVENGISLISFSYNLPLGYIDENVVWDLMNTVNRFPIRINGRIFPRRSLLLDKINLSTESYSPVASGDTSPQLEIEYSKVSIQMTYRPQTYNMQYLNVGTLVPKVGAIGQMPVSFPWGNLSASANNNSLFSDKDDGGPEKIYRWVDVDGKTRYTGFSLYRYAYWNRLTLNGEANGEEVTEPMFLDNINPDNITGVMGFDDMGRQIPSYLTGCPYFPADWSELAIPPDTGWRRMVDGSYV